MLNTVKERIYYYGGGAGDAARRFRGNSAKVARRVGRRTREMAREVEPRQAILGIVIAGAVIGGGILLARYLKRRREELPIEGGVDRMRELDRNMRGTVSGTSAVY